MDKVVTAFYLYLVHCANVRKRKNQIRYRRWSVRPINRDWYTAGYFRKTFKKMEEVGDDEQFFIHNRMTKSLFKILLTLIGNALRKPRQRISTEERLSITLLYLGHGVSMQSIAWSHKIGKSTARQIILETCEVLWKILAPLYISPPTQSQYEDIAADFWTSWNMPNCVGAVDGKHIAIKCPKSSGSAWFNYKKFFSTVLMAVCDAHYTFIAVSIGSYGSESDGGVFKASPFGEALNQGKLPLPPPKPLPGCQNREPFPHFFVGDAAFPLGPHLMKPIAPGRRGEMLDEQSTVFNYRLSRARRTIENAFGILAARWRILNTTLELMPENCESIVLATIALHNFIMRNDTDRMYCSSTYVDRDAPDNTTILGGWRADIGSNGCLRDYNSHTRRSSKSALQLRQRLCTYLSAEGAVSFQ